MRAFIARTIAILLSKDPIIKPSQPAMFLYRKRYKHSSILLYRKPCIKWILTMDGAKLLEGDKACKG